MAVRDDGVELSGRQIKGKSESKCYQHDSARKTVGGKWREGLSS